MIRLNDIILVLVLFVSMAAGILWPRVGSVFQPYLLYAMMSLLFLSLLNIRINTLRETIRTNYGRMFCLTGLKLIALPVAAFYLFRALWPSYALAALLLSGMSTGVVAPFISNLVKANSPLVLVMVALTSLLVPFTLPLLVKILSSNVMDVSLPAMIRMLCMVVFVPFAAVQLMRRTTPRILDGIMKRGFPISLALFALINLGVFSRYAEFFLQKPSTILFAGLAALALAAIYLVVGLAVLWGQPVRDRLASAVSLGNINNVLVIVFASQFFSPLEPTVGAMYMIPFFGLILPLRAYDRWHAVGSDD